MSELQDNKVVPLPIKPKEVRFTHNKVPCKLSFNPATGKWKWEIEIIIKSKYHEIAETEDKARKAAIKYIEKNGIGG